MEEIFPRSSCSRMPVIHQTNLFHFRLKVKASIFKYNLIQVKKKFSHTGCNFTVWTSAGSKQLLFIVTLSCNNHAGSLIIHFHDQRQLVILNIPVLSKLKLTNSKLPASYHDDKHQFHIRHDNI